MYAVVSGNTCTANAHYFLCIFDGLSSTYLVCRTRQPALKFGWVWLEVLTKFFDSLSCYAFYFLCIFILMRFCLFLHKVHANFLINWIHHQEIIKKTNNNVNKIRNNCF